MTSEHHIAALAKAVRQYHFHTNGAFVRHGVQVRIQAGNQAHAEFPDDPRGLDALFVVFESLFRGETRHAHVVAGFTVPSGISQIHDVHRVMALKLIRHVVRPLDHVFV